MQPEKALEANTDSLRDFIISLDKSKADKLRYKVEDKFVRIYITPYRTSISEKDLVFSEGDFNVDVVLALGVRERTQIDAAITAHGRILHDATVISVNAGQDKAPDIGQLNWQEPTASSLCEMLVSISEAFGTGLIDNQMATSFLTGIVAETQRFSNTKTSPKVMTMAAQLMAAGANQQLIVSKLEPPTPPESAKPVRPPKTPKSPPTDTLRVSHEAGQQDSPEVEVKPGEIHIDEQGNIVSKAEPAAPAAVPLPPPSVPAQPAPMAYEPLKSEPVVLPPEPEQPISPHTRPNLNLPQAHAQVQPPSGSPAPAPHELLDPADHKPSISPPFSADTQPLWYDPENSSPLDPLSDVPRPSDAILHQEKFNTASDAEPSKTVEPPKNDSTPTFPTPQVFNPTAGSATGVDSARSAVDAALAAAPFNPAVEGPVAALNSQPLSNDLHPSANKIEKPAPPPVPPPLQLDSGAMIPTTATPANKT